MSDISRVKLFGKLNPAAYKAIESATTFCKLRGNPYVELSHWLHQIAEARGLDFHAIVAAFDISTAQLSQDMTRALDGLPRGASSITDLASHVDEVVERAWVFATLVFDGTQVRTGHLLLAMLKTPDLKNALLAISGEFRRIKADELLECFTEICGDSVEAQLVPAASGGVPGEASGAVAPPAMGKLEALARYAVDLTERARSGELDPIVGRDDEIRQVIDILMRRRQNNPILTGEAGVGKTAVVEGFAQRIAAGEVPPALRDVSVRTLDIGLLQAGASMKGEFENRLKQVIEEAQSSPRPIILFVDEAHTLIGAGGAQGTGDAANLLKPALARGTLRTIAATTWSEYKKYIEKDPALTRRFQVVKVPEPDEERAIRMMRGVAAALEAHHRVTVLDEALSAAVKLSHRYIPARQLPDKSISLIDTACARVAVGQHAVPAPIEDARRRIEALDVELGIIARERRVGIGVVDREERAAATRAATERELADLEERWERERALVAEVLRLREALAEEVAADGSVDPTRPTDPGEPQASLAALAEAQASLAEVQGERPLISPAVDAQAVASVVGDWTGIPVGRMVRDEVEAVLKLAETVGARVVGQDHALAMIARRIQTSRAGLDSPDKPVGVFMLAGPSGVGKTETALALAETLYGGEHNLVTINMSEFQEAHTVSTLKGAPPGYVGYGEGGVLTEAVRRRPHSVVLLDEIEKAHPDVHELFFQVFDKGMMEDGEGRQIDFRNTLILLTTNVGSDLITRMGRSPDGLPPPETIAHALRRPLLEVFPAALLGRIVTVPYLSLNDDMLRRIVRLQLGRIQDRLRASRDTEMSFEESVVALIVDRCQEVESGGRMIDAILTNTMLPAMSRELLTRTLRGDPIKRVRVAVAEGDLSYAFEG